MHGAGQGGEGGQGGGGQGACVIGPWCAGFHLQPIQHAARVNPPDQGGPEVFGLGFWGVRGSGGQNSEASN